MPGARKPLPEAPPAGGEWFRDLLPPAALAALAQAGETGRREGAAVYLVGGVVRDLLLGKECADLDLVVEGDGPSLARNLAASWGARVVCHPRFGTASVFFPHGGRLDVATARRETYPHPGALPRVEPANLAADLARRDFTVNAMAVDLRPGLFGRLQDPYGGLADLRAGLLRILHPRSFLDDPTRVLRAARLEERLGFRLEPLTLARAVEPAVRAALDNVSGPRIWYELRRLLTLPGAPGALRRLAELGLAGGLWPWLPGSPWARAERLAGWLAAIPARPELAFLAFLLYPLPEEAAGRVVENYGLPRRERRAAGRSREAGRLLANAPAGLAEMHRRLRGLPAESVLAALAWQDGPDPAPMLAYLSRRAGARPPAGAGLLLRELGLAPGPLYGELLGDLEGACLEGSVRTREEAREFLAARLREKGISDVLS